MVRSAYAESVWKFASESNHYLRIPELQREFVWDATNIKTLLRDMIFHQNQDQLGEMFLGPIILHELDMTHDIYEGKIPPYRELLLLDEGAFSQIAQDIFPDDWGDIGLREEFTNRIEEKRERSGLIDGQQRITILTILCRILYSKIDDGSDLAIRLKKIYTHTSDNLRLQHVHENDGLDYRSIFENHDDWYKKKKDAGLALHKANEEVETAIVTVGGIEDSLAEVAETARAEADRLAEVAETATAEALAAMGGADEADKIDARDGARVASEMAEAAASAAEGAAEVAEVSSKVTETAEKSVKAISLKGKQRKDPGEAETEAGAARAEADRLAGEAGTARAEADRLAEVAETATAEALAAMGGADEADKIDARDGARVASEMAEAAASAAEGAAEVAETAASAAEVVSKAAEAVKDAAIRWSDGTQQWPESRLKNYFRLAYDVLSEWVDGMDGGAARAEADRLAEVAETATAEALAAMGGADEADKIDARDGAIEAAEAAEDDAKAAKLAELTNFSDGLMDNVELVTISISNEKQVHLVFRSLNSLGKSLTVSQKIKNELFSMAVLGGGDDVPTKVQWNNIVNTLSPLTKKKRTSIDDFLFIYCRSKGITRPPTRRTSKLSKNDIYAVFSDPKTPLYFQSENQTETGLFDKNCRVLEDEILVSKSDKVAIFTKEIANYAEGYMRVLEPSTLSAAPYNVKSKQVNEIVDLSNIFTAQLRPYFLAAFMNTIGQSSIQEQNTPQKRKAVMINNRVHFKKLIRAISTATVRLVVTGKKRANDFEHDINRWVGYIAGKSAPVAIIAINEEVNKLINKHWAGEGPEGDIGTPAWISTVDDGFENYLIEDLILRKDSGGADMGTAKYLIRGCEGAEKWSNLKPLVQEYYSTDLYTVEHILPKTAWEYWECDHPNILKRGPWGREWEILDRPQAPADRAWPIEQDDMEPLAFKLGNHILLENRVNTKASTKTWSGPDLIARGIAMPVEPTNRWGKFHFYSFFEWWETDEQEENGEVCNNGSHLKAVKEFCSTHEIDDQWTKDLLNERTKYLADKAKAVEEWKIW